MSDNNNWPGKPGVPLNPERDQWHWLASSEGPVPALWARPAWRHCRDFWIDQAKPEWMEWQGWTYIGPCLTPAEMDARIATARKDALEEAAQRLEELHKNHNYDPESGTLTRKLGRYDKWPESAKAAKLEHDTGYYRAIAEGVAHIRALAKGEGDE